MLVGATAGGWVGGIAVGAACPHAAKTSVTKASMPMAGLKGWRRCLPRFSFLTVSKFLIIWILSLFTI
jgi:hypothetical protein